MIFVIMVGTDKIGPKANKESRENDMFGGSIKGLYVDVLIKSF